MDSDQISTAVSDMATSVRGVLIAVPFYKNEHLVELLVSSLIRCSDDIAAIEAEVVLYADSPEYGALEATLQKALPKAQSAFPCRLVCNQQNLGFVGTMNLAVAEAVARRRDLVLLNSDTQMEPGTLTEMVRVMGLDHMIGFVNPRSNNATIATLPLRAVPAGHQVALAAYRRFAAKLPPVSYVPTAVGFCLLIRWRLIAAFGGFDTVYGSGYNEENDLVMRASRCGFRAVLANHAFVWHEGEESFTTAPIDRSVLEPINRSILSKRYPEYDNYLLAHHQAPETVAEELLAATLPDAEGKLDVAFDFSSFRAAHNGTFLAGRQVLSAARRVWGSGFRIFVLCAADVYAFHDLGALGIPRADAHADKKFAAIFRVGQPYDWNSVQRLIMRGAVLGVYMLDTISIDCPQLTSQHLYNMWQFTLDHIDVLATQSQQTKAQFAARFTLAPETAQLVSWHSLDVSDYVLPIAAGNSCRKADPRQRILVLGNHFHHKFLAQTANLLAAAFPDRHVVALGQEMQRESDSADEMAPPPLDSLENLSGVAVGNLSDADIGRHYADCDVVVFPSHAEGFGFPVLNALAAKRPVLLRRLPVFEEIWNALGNTPNMQFYDSAEELIHLLRFAPRWVEWVPPAGNGADRSAREIKNALDAATARVDYQRIVRRIRAVQFASSLAPDAGVVPLDSESAEVARFAARRIEPILQRIFAIKWVYLSARILFRAARRTRRGARELVGRSRDWGDRAGPS